MRAWWASGLAAVLGACVEPRAITCDDGVVCAPQLACAPTGGGCVDPAQIAACDGKVDGAACTLEVGVGACVDAVCTLGGCGNAEIEPGEACDDGNTTSGDGCRADCGKVEACGDAVVDAGEACDDGNANEVDGCDACVVTTWSAAALLAGAVDAHAVDVVAPRVTIDVRGDLYLVDITGNRVWRVAHADGTITTIAGTGESGESGDGGPATAAQLLAPVALAVDGRGDVYLVDGNRVRRITAADGTIVTIAGTGALGGGGDGGPATSAQLRTPRGVAVDGRGNVFIADTENHRVRRVDGATGTITTFAGTGAGGFSGDGGPATAAQLSSPFDVAVDRAGNVYVSDASNGRVRRIGGDGYIATIAGGGASTAEDVVATTASLAVPRAVAVDADGDVSIVELFGHRVRRIGAGDGRITTIIGTGTAGDSGDGGPAIAAEISYPEGVAIGPRGEVCVAEGRVRCVDPATGILTTTAGSTAMGPGDDDRLATSVTLAFDGRLALAPDGAVLLADTGHQRMRRVDPTTGLISTVVGDGTAGSTGDGGPATSARLFYPRGVAVDSVGRIYVADTANHRVRRVESDGTLTTVVGTGTAAFAGDGGPAASAAIGSPTSLMLDADDNLYIADAGNRAVRRVDAATGIISTIAGTGVGAAVPSPDGGLATATPLGSVTELAFDAAGNLYLNEVERVRRVDAGTGIISTIAGTTTGGFAGDGGPATAARLSGVRGMAVMADGALLIADSGNARIRRVDPATGVISTFIGDAGSGGSGDGGPAALAQLTAPTALVLDAAGNLFIGDGSAGRVRRVDAATGVITTVAGKIEGDGLGPLDLAQLTGPQAMLRSADGTTWFASRDAHGVQAILAGSDALATVIGRYPQAVATGDLARYRDATFGTVGGVAFDAAAGRHGVLYLSESSASRLHVVTLVDPGDPTTWTIAALGAGSPGFADGALAGARFTDPRGLWFDAATRTLYVADAGNHVVRAIDVDAQQVTTVAGTPRTLGFFGDGGAATDALLFAPTAVARAPTGDLFIADTANHRVRRVAAGNGVISTVLGDGVAASSGEGAPATAFPVHAPDALAIDVRGNLFVTSSTAVRLLVADAAGEVDGTGAVQTIFGAAPRDAFPASATACLTGLALVDLATVQVTDACAGLLVELRRAPELP